MIIESLSGQWLQPSNIRKYCIRFIQFTPQTQKSHLSAQQNLTKVDLAVIVLSAPNNRLETLKPLVPRIKEVIASIQTGEIVYV